jgi:hypothetical protein
METVMPGRFSPVERRVMVAPRNRVADPLGNRLAGREPRTGQHRDELFAAIASRQIAIANALLQGRCHQSKHLIADTVTKIVVDLLEMIDVDQEHAERLAAFHRRNLRVAKELIERPAVWQAGEYVGPGTLLRFAQGIADDIELAGRFDKPRLEFCGARGGLRQLVHQALDDQFGIDPGLAAIGDIADGLDVRTVIVDRGGQELLCGDHHRMQVLRGIVDYRVVIGFRSEIGRK